jgi:carbon monoxide dehydrogenase subunit G
MPFHMTLPHHVDKPSDFIFDYLSDMQKFVSVNSVINKIVSLGGQQYKGYETLKIGFIPYSLRILPP